MAFCAKLVVALGLALLAVHSSEGGATVCVQTGTVTWARSDSYIYIQFEGTDNVLSKMYLLDAPGGHDDFESGDYWCYELPNLPFKKLTKIHLKMTESGDEPGWYVNYVTVYYGNLHYKAVFNAWLSSHEGYHLQQVRPVTRVEDMFTVCTKTGIRPYAGTSSKVEVRLHTDTFISNWLTLKSMGGFWKDRTRCFGVEHAGTKNLGKAQSIDMRIDGTKDLPEWDVEDVWVGLDYHHYAKGHVGRWVAKVTPVMGLRLV